MPDLIYYLITGFLKRKINISDNFPLYFPLFLLTGNHSKDLLPCKQKFLQQRIMNYNGHFLNNFLLFLFLTIFCLFLVFNKFLRFSCFYLLFLALCFALCFLLSSASCFFLALLSNSCPLLAYFIISCFFLLCEKKSVNKKEKYISLKFDGLF